LPFPPAKGGRMNIQSEIQNIMDRAAQQLCAMVDEKLRYFRGICMTDEEFGNRMSEITFQNIPLMKQYTFDGVPVFYSLITFTEYNINIEVGNGEYKP
jgi:hypothetical protein